MFNTPQQLDFGAMLFGSGRTVLYVSEVAEKLGLTEQAVRDMIESGELGAVNVAGSTETRKYWRIPVPEYEKFLKQRQNK